MILVSRLSLLTWIRLSPVLIASRPRPCGPLRLSYFEATRGGLTALRIWTRFGFVVGSPVDFSYVDVLLPDGSLAGPRVEQEDTLAFSAEVAADLFDGHPVLQRFGATDARSRLFLDRCLAESVTPMLMEITVAAWFGRTQRGAGDGPTVLVTSCSPWADRLERYARERGVTLKYDRWSLGRPKPRLSDAGRIVGAACRAARARLRRWARRGSRPPGAPALGQTPPRAVVAISYYGKGVGLDPGCNSDLFWVPFADLAPGQALLYFSAPDDPLDASKLQTLERQGVCAMAVSRGATIGAGPMWRRVPDYPALWKRVRRLARAAVGWPRRGARLQCWLVLNLAYFSLRISLWRAFFASHRVGISVDYDVVDDRLAADLALAELGGVSVSFQRHDEPVPNLHRARAVDVHFGFGPRQVAIERASRSSIGEFVVSGYPFDQAFVRVRANARALRHRLEARGAKFVVCFFDEHSLTDPRRGPSHAYRAENYRFLLERLLADPTLGLVFKPKKASTLRARLGDHVRLLDRALVTGRCALFEEGVVATPVLPCEASQAADVAIGLLFGTTAGFESALAGTPTLFLDRERTLDHPLYEMGPGRVVFADWESLWRGLEAYRRDPHSQPGFGVWSPTIERLDPYRDGRAAERIGRYIGWLAEELSAGAPPAQAISAASKRFSDRWGAEMIVRRDQAIPRPDAGVDELATVAARYGSCEGEGRRCS